MIRKARKEHLCRWQISPRCSKVIKRGDEYAMVRIPKESMEYGDGICMACLTFKKVEGAKSEERKRAKKSGEVA